MSNPKEISLKFGYNDRKVAVSSVLCINIGYSDRNKISIHVKNRFFFGLMCFYFSDMAHQNSPCASCKIVEYSGFIKIENVCNYIQAVNQKVYLAKH